MAGSASLGRFLEPLKDTSVAIILILCPFWRVQRECNQPVTLTSRILTTAFHIEAVLQ